MKEIIIKKETRIVFRGEKGKVILTSHGRYKQAKILVYSNRERIWVMQSDLKLDKEYYRDKKIKKMLDE